MTSSNGNSIRVTGPFAGNSPVTGEFLSRRPVTRSFGVFFDLCLNKRLSKQLWGWWFETPLFSLWRHCNEVSTGSTAINDSCGMFLMNILQKINCVTPLPHSITYCYRWSPSIVLWWCRGRSHFERGWGCFGTGTLTCQSTPRGPPSYQWR